MNLLKKSLVTLGLLGAFTVSATAAHAATIYFEVKGTVISYDNDAKKWRSTANTKGSTGTKYSRTYTEIWADGVKKDYKNSGKVTGASSNASAYAAIGFGYYEAPSAHRIWWSSDDADSVFDESRDYFKSN
ncbi:hypothetical protein P4V39_17175 [Brevibacillus borstelensis]|uniref:hypothetical protein n=1 Tax=Brevibacillus borstelensis TaxID=45462 RepID=UPI002E22BCE6|nr:hypothetical protein [Brevibacillus borstelensis]